MLDNLRTKATQGAAIKLLQLRSDSPKLLFAAGAVGFLATIVLSSRATLQMDAVLREGEAKKDEIAQERAIADRDGKDYDDQKAGLSVRVNTALKIAKIYAPAVVVGGLTIAALTGSHVTLSRRNVGLTAAYAALDKGFREYRGRVVEEFGAEKDQELRYGYELVEQAVDTDEGPVVKTVKKPLMTESIYSRIWAKETSFKWSPEFGKNQLTIKVQEQYANDLLNARGYVFLNEVLTGLGLDDSSMGQVVGWVLPEYGGVDGYVDFGIFRDIEMGQNFANGNNNSVLLDFNVDGDILGKLDAMKKAKKAASQGLMGS